MFLKIKNRLEKELRRYLADLDTRYKLRNISPLLSLSIKDFIARDGKRIRPALFVIGYLGFAKKEPPGLYRSALASEIFHDFMLIHDDIIDKSPTRRGKPSMHTLLGANLRKLRNIKFNGQDLAIVAGDILYAMAIDCFLDIKEDLKRKERALRRLIQAGIQTGSGEFIELLCGARGIKDIGLEDIYKIYDLKTAYYTFSAPLSMGAILSGATQQQIQALHDYGIYVGRAFQIKDDILGLFADEKEIGKSNITDLQEAKKTPLIWFAYNHSNAKNKALIKGIFTKSRVHKKDLLLMRSIVLTCGARAYAEGEIFRFIAKANALLSGCKMRPAYKNALLEYSKKLL